MSTDGFPYSLDDGRTVGVQPVKPLSAPQLTPDGAYAMLVSECKCRALEALRADRMGDAAIWAGCAEELKTREGQT